MDFTFGKLISDDLKLTSHRANLKGVQHQHMIMPRDPVPGKSVESIWRRPATRRLNGPSCAIRPMGPTRAPLAKAHGRWLFARYTRSGIR